MTKNPLSRSASIILFIIACAACARADVDVANVFADHMVLQRGRALPVWGEATPGESVVVRFGGQEKRARADSAGRWLVRLDVMRASDAGRTLIVTGRNVVRVEDVLVGEVWMCAGQSNMAMRLGDTLGGAETAARADHPTIRVFTPAHKLATAKGQDVTGAWIAVTPATAASITAVGFYFGRELLSKLKVPIGLIDTSWGSTSAEAWTPIEYLAARAELRSTIEIMEVWKRERDSVRAKYEARLAEWRRSVESAKARGEKPPARPIAPDAIRPERAAGILYDSLIEPLDPFPIRGVIWYQGENNAGRAAQYRTLLPTMIHAWRERRKQLDMPFGIVQLPGRWHPAPQPTDIAWSHLRDAQLNTYRTTPHTGLVVTLDVGDPEDGHPKNKQPVGERLARWASADVYGLKLTVSAPVFQSHEIKSGEVVIKFTHIGKGIAARGGGGSLQHFAIAGADRVWRWADARIVGRDAVIVSSKEVAAPVAVRYAWAGNPASADLTNDTGLPASPFRTDDWAETGGKPETIPDR